MRVKTEVNTREHFTLLGHTEKSTSLATRWFSGEAMVQTYELSELLGTKLRALYQRKKGRDLYDLSLGLDHPDFDDDAVIRSFRSYMAFGDNTIDRDAFEMNVEEKLGDPGFVDDIRPLLRTGVGYDPQEAWRRVRSTLVSRL